MKIHEGKIALITGSTRGIGKAIALELARQGATILMHGSQETPESHNSFLEISTISPLSKLYFAQIDNFEEVDALGKKVRSDFDHLDILVNNAGIAKSSTFINMSNEDWDKVIQVNLYGTFYVTKVCLPLIPEGKEGRIINISSVYGLTGEFGQINYSTSKAAIIGFTKSLAKELAKKNITVNAVCPGLMDTGLIADIPEKYLEEKITKIPMQRLGKKEEVAYLVSFLGTNKASYITGQAISVNGGMY